MRRFYLNSRVILFFLLMVIFSIFAPYSQDIHSQEINPSEIETLNKKGLKTDQGENFDSEAINKIVEEYVDENGYSDIEEIDYSDSKYLPPAGKQEENSCVGWAVGYYLRTYQLAKEKNWDIVEDGEIIKERVFSPNYIYNQINDGVDKGSTLEDAGNLIKDVGIATLSEFPYVPGDYRSKPSYKTVRSGYKYRIEDFYMLFSRKEEGDYKIETLKKYLLTGDLPVIGIDAGYSWENPYMDEEGNHIVVSDDTYTGGHAVLVVGYDDNFKTKDGLGAFKVLNSWGSEWGNDGYAYASYKAIIDDSISGAVYTDPSRFYVEREHRPYIDGYEDNKFKPNRFVSRAETVKMLVDLDGIKSSKDIYFKDVNSGYWAEDYITFAREKNYISGYPDGSFRPDDPITRTEFAHIMYRYMGNSIPEGGEYLISKYFYDVVGHWNSKGINILGSMDILRGYLDGSFKPNEYISRAEAVSIVNRIKERIPDRENADLLSQKGVAFDDVSENWAYYDILEASKSHLFEYRLEDYELVEAWMDMKE